MMKRMTKFLSFILAAVMVLGAMPLTATVSFAGNTVDSGTCGDNLTWTLDSDGVLTINGKGEMLDADWSMEPHQSSKDSVKKVMIGSGVTSICNYAFSGFKYLEAVSIPNSVETIGYGAFKDCVSLGSLTIPDSVTRIDEYDTLSGCTSLTDLKIGNGMTYIGYIAKLEGLQSLTLGEGITTITTNDFSGLTNLASIQLSDNVKVIRAEALINTAFYKNEANWKDGVLYLGKYLIAADPYTLSGEYTVREGTLMIASAAFSDCRQLTGITIPASLRSIGSNAFKNCNGLKRVDITDIAAWCGIDFGSNPLDNAHNLHINGTLAETITVPGRVERISDGSFQGCTSLTEVTLEKGVKHIGASAFYGCSGLTDVTIPEGIESIGAKAFYSCSLNKVSLPSTLLSIGEGAFDLRNWVDGIYDIDEGAYYIGDYLIKTDSSAMPKNYKVRTGTRVIADSAFNKCSNLESLTLPAGLTSIPAKAFANCSSLAKIEIPNTVVSIGVNAFLNCNSLTEINLPDSVVSIGDSAFLSCNGLTKIDIPDSVVSIGNYAFNTCKNLSTVSFGSGLQKLGQECFDAGTISELRIKDLAAWCGVDFISGAPQSMSGHGIATTSDAKLYVGGKETTELIIPDGVPDISPYAFTGFGMITGVTIPDGVKTVGKNAFSYCKNLKNTTIDAETIEPYAFYNCTGIESITLGNNVEAIEDSAFDDCKNLKSVTFGDGIKTIASAFDGCNALSEVYISDLAAWCGIEFGAFAAKTLYLNGELVTDLVIPDTVTEIKAYSFAGFTCIERLELPASVASIGERAFYSCNNLKETVFYGTQEQWDAIRIASYNDALTKSRLVLTSGDCGENAFWAMDINGTLRITGTGEVVIDSIYAPWQEFAARIKEVVIGAGITEIPGNAFVFDDVNGEQYQYRQLARFTVEEGSDGFSTDGTGVLFNKDKTVLIKYPTGLDTEKYSVPASVAEIADSAFAYTASLKSVKLSDKLTDIGHSAFFGCKNLTDVSIPESVLRIGDQAFKQTGYYLNEKNWNNGVLYLDNCLIALSAFSSGDWASPGSPEDNPYPEYGFGQIPENYTVREGTRVLAYAAFRHSRVKNLVLPEGLRSIPEMCFSKSIDLQKLELPNSLETICDFAFVYAESLKEISLSESLKSIGDGAFHHCSVSDIYYSGTEAQWNKVSLPDGFDELNITVHFDSAPAPTEPTTTAEPTSEPGSKPTTQPIQTDGIFSFGDGVSSFETADSVKYASKAALTKSDLVASVSGTYAGAAVTVKDRNGNEIANDATLGTGSTVTVILGDTTLTKTIVFIGDVDGDANVNATDARLVLRAAAKLDMLEGAFATAADPDGSNSINATDARMILRAAAKLDDPSTWLA